MKILFYLFNIVKYIFLFKLFSWRGTVRYFKSYFSLKLVLYLFRWQSSSVILYPCVAYLPFNDAYNVIISNLIGGLIYFPIDALIFKFKNRKKK